MITLTVNERDLTFEHSLVSLFEWEQEYEKPFFPPPPEEAKTVEETDRYFEMMLVGESRQYRHLIMLLSEDDRRRLLAYINKTNTATKVREMAGKNGPRENVTAELIYYWLIQFKIPFKPTDEWHLNNLLMLVKVCGAKATPPKKTRQSRTQMAASMREENERRRKLSGSSG